MIKAKVRLLKTGSLVLLLFVLLFTAKGAIAKTGGANSETEAKTKAAETYGKLPLSFIQNNGQTDKTVKFYEKGAGHATFFTEGGVYLQLVRGQGIEVKGQGAGGKGQKREDRQIRDGRRMKDKLSDKKTVESDIVRLIPLNANPNPQVIAEAPQEGKVNYFRGNDQKKWKTNIPTYGAVVYKDLYKGIDMKFYGNNRQLEYDIIVSPGTDPSQVKLSYEGIQGLKVTESGDLEITLHSPSPLKGEACTEPVECGRGEGGKLIQKKPYIYQNIDGKKVEVAGRFNLNSPSPLEGEGGGEGKFSYGFQIASYNKAYPLIIDPVLVYSTYLGGSGTDEGMSIAVDGTGNAYVTGYTYSTGFSTKTPIEGVKVGGSDVFITKINSAGNAIVYSTYLGGSGYDYGNGIAVDSSGNAYVTGYTYSTDFPTHNPIQGTYAGGLGGDAFVTKIDAAGTALVYSTYLGGSGGDNAYGIAVDSSGNAYVTGSTNSIDFPTQNPLQGVLAVGAANAFVTKINAAGTALVYSTYLGGSDFDVGLGIAVDGSGNAYVTGNTHSTDFPTQNPLQGANAGVYFAFVTKINAAGTALVYSTYLGGSRAEGNGIAVDGSGNAYVTGYTESGFPTQNAIQGYRDAWDAFVTKINSAGTALVYSTYLGGSGDDHCTGIAVDSSGNAYVTGYTGSTDFPTRNAIQEANAGGGLYNWDAFVTKINSAGTALVYSTYLGGGGTDTGDGIAVDGSGNAYVTGLTGSTDFPTHKPIQGANGGGEYHNDAFVTMIADAVFSDVPYDYWAYDYINAIYNAGITSGCGGGNYCPESLVTRGQMAVFVVKALGEQPAATCTGTVFNDVNANMNGGEGFCRYIEKFRALNITAGCAVDNSGTPQNEAAYCPDNNVTRAQMAIFLTKALGEQPSVTCTGTIFYDVNAWMNGGDAFCRYIEKFRELNITAGCATNNPNTPQNEAAYCPDNDVTRAQMAVFLTKGFLQ